MGTNYIYTSYPEGVCDAGDIADYYEDLEDNLRANREIVQKIISKNVPCIIDYEAENNTLLDHLTWVCSNLTSKVFVNEKVKNRLKYLKKIIENGDLGGTDDFCKVAQRELERLQSDIDFTKEQFKVKLLAFLIKMIEPDLNKRTLAVKVSNIMHDLNIHDKTPFPTGDYNNAGDKAMIWERMKNYSKLLD